MALPDKRQTPFVWQLFQPSDGGNAQGPVLPPVPRSRQDLEAMLDQLYPAHKSASVNHGASSDDRGGSSSGESTHPTLPSTSLRSDMNLFQSHSETSSSSRGGGRMTVQPGVLELKRVMPFKLFGGEQQGPQPKRSKIVMSLPDVMRSRGSAEATPPPAPAPRAPALERLQETVTTATSTTTTVVETEDVLQEVLAGAQSPMGVTTITPVTTAISKPTPPSQQQQQQQQQKTTLTTAPIEKTPPREQSPFHTPSQSPVISRAAAATTSTEETTRPATKKVFLPPGYAPAFPTDFQKQRCDVKTKVAQSRMNDAVAKKNYFQQTIDLLNHPLMDECRLGTKDQALQSGKTRLLKELIDYWLDRKQPVRLAVIVYDMNMEQWLVDYAKCERKLAVERLSDIIEIDWRQERGIVIGINESRQSLATSRRRCVDIMLVFDIRVRPANPVFNKLICRRPPLYVCTLGTVEQRAALYYQSDVQNSYTWSNLWWSADSKYHRLITEDNDWQECVDADSLFDATVKSVIDWYSRRAGTAYEFVRPREDQREEEEQVSAATTTQPRLPESPHVVQIPATATTSTTTSQLPTTVQTKQVQPPAPAPAAIRLPKEEQQRVQLANEKTTAPQTTEVQEAQLPTSVASATRLPETAHVQREQVASAVPPISQLRGTMQIQQERLAAIIEDHPLVAIPPRLPATTPAQTLESIGRAPTPTLPSPSPPGTPEPVTDEMMDLTNDEEEEQAPQPMQQQQEQQIVSEQQQPAAAATVSYVSAQTSVPDHALTAIMEGMTEGLELSDKVAERIKKLFAFRPAIFELSPFASPQSTTHSPRTDGSDDGESYYSATDHDLGEEVRSLGDDGITGVLKTCKDAYDKECEMILQRLQTQYEQEVEMVRKMFARKALGHIRSLAEGRESSSS